LIHGTQPNLFSVSVNKEGFRHRNVASTLY
jgi:hypothetical protein